MKPFSYDNIAGGRLLAVLEAVGASERPAKPAEIARATGLNRATVFRLLAFLTHQGYLYKDEYEGTYLIGYKLFILGHANRLQENVVRQSRPALLRLTHEHDLCAQIAYLEGASIVILDKSESRGSPAVPTSRGQRIAAHATALGRILLAFHDPAKLFERFASAGHAGAASDGAFRGIESLLASLPVIRAQGFLVSHGEYADGISCIAAPVIDMSQQAYFAIAVSGPTARIRKVQDRLLESVRAAAAELRRAVLWRDIDDKWLDPRWE